MPRLQHVSLPIPAGAQDEGRAFYSGLLGFAEKHVPTTRQAAGLVWFAAGEGELELHLVPDPVGLVSGAQRHVCFEVDDSSALRRQLEAVGVPTEDAPPIANRPRFYCTDPFGNRLELVTIVGDYA